jgi:aconitate hydratase
MGMLPLQFEEGQNRDAIGLTGFELYDIDGIAQELHPGKKMQVIAKGSDGRVIKFTVKCRLDTPMEVDYYKNDGILQYVLRSLLKK